MTPRRAKRFPIRIPMEARKGVGQAWLMQLNQRVFNATQNARELVEKAERSRESMRSQLIGALWGNFQLQKLIGYERPNESEVARVLEAMGERMKTGNGMGF